MFLPQSISFSILRLISQRKTKIYFFQQQAISFFLGSIFMLKTFFFRAMLILNKSLGIVRHESLHLLFQQQQKQFHFKVSHELWLHAVKLTLYCHLIFKDENAIKIHTL